MQVKIDECAGQKTLGDMAHRDTQPLCLSPGYGFPKHNNTPAHTLTHTRAHKGKHGGLATSLLHCVKMRMLVKHNAIFFGTQNGPYHGQFKVERACNTKLVDPGSSLCVAASAWPNYSRIMIGAKNNGAGIGMCLCGSSDVATYHFHAILGFLALLHFAYRRLPAQMVNTRNCLEWFIKIWNLGFYTVLIEQCRGCNACSRKHTFPSAIPIRMLSQVFAICMYVVVCGGVNLSRRAFGQRRLFWSTFSCMLPG